VTWKFSLASYQHPEALAWPPFNTGQDQQVT